MTLKYRVLRDISYLKNTWDDVRLPININNDNIAEQVIDFFYTTSKFIYPAKSYFVALVYAACFVEFFDEKFYQMLDDPELLTQDMYFIPYHRKKDIYDKILNIIQPSSILSYQSTQKTVIYFKQEFALCK